MNRWGEQSSKTQLTESDSLHPHQHIKSIQMDPFPESGKSHLESCHDMTDIHLPGEDNKKTIV